MYYRKILIKCWHEGGYKSIKQDKEFRNRPTKILSINFWHKNQNKCGKDILLNEGLCHNLVFVWKKILPLLHITLRNKMYHKFKIQKLELFSIWKKTRENVYDPWLNQNRTKYMNNERKTKLDIIKLLNFHFWKHH